jgi:DNA repair protein RadD
MRMTLMDPARLRLPKDDESVKKFLTFHDRQVEFQISRLKQNFRWKQSDPDRFTAALAKLKGEAVKTLIYYDRVGEPWTYAGLWQELSQRFGWQFDVPPLDFEFGSIPWAKIPKEMRYYQNEAVEALLRSRHSAIELPTGSGKSRILLELAKRIGQKTILVTPSAAITDQMYEQFVEAFGRRYVGKYGDGRKDVGKLFTVAVAQSMTRIEEGSDAYNDFSKAKALLWDESHTTPADTFERVALGVCRNAPIRSFVSATQLRTDGAELILRGITGPVVYRKKFIELVDEGFLARPMFKIIRVPAVPGAGQRDVKEETRRQLYANPNVNKVAAMIAGKMVRDLNRQVVILVEEFRQFMILKNYLDVPFEFVHGGATSKETKKFLPEEYHKCDTARIVKEFNEGKIRCLIGTSAISTGVDLQPVGCLIYLQGGVSEIKVTQSIGRGTRMPPGKKDFYVVDFRVVGSPVMERHLEERKSIYDTMGQVQES